MQNLLLSEGCQVELRSILHPPAGSFVRFRPHDDTFLNVAAQQVPITQKLGTSHEENDDQIFKTLGIPPSRRLRLPHQEAEVRLPTESFVRFRSHEDYTLVNVAAQHATQTRYLYSIGTTNPYPKDDDAPSRVIRN